MKSFANKTVCLLSAVLLFLGCFVYTDTKAAVKTDKGKIKTEEKVKEAVKPDKEQAKPEEKTEIQKGLPQKEDVQPTPPRPIIERDTSIKTLFEGVQIPDTAKFFQALMRGFPVSPNALGDMNRDSIVNIWDLLRVRNISLGIGDPPSSYELVDGDLTRDGAINQADVILFRDVFLQKAGLPHIVDSTGGIVSGGEVTVTIPPGAVDTAIVVSVKSVRPDTFAAANSIDLKAAEVDSAWLTAAFELDAGGYEFKKPLNLEIRPFAIPPCSLRAYNGLFTIGGDANLDGLPDVYPVGELIPNADSTALVSPPPQIPIIDSITAEGREPRSMAKSGMTLTTRPGRVFTIDGSNLLKIGALVHFSNGVDSVTLRALPVLSGGGGGLRVLTPALPPGNYSVRILLSANGFISNEFYVNILESLPPPGNPDSLITAFLDTVIASHNEIYARTEADTTIRQEERLAMLQATLDDINNLSVIKDSLSFLDASTRSQIASVIAEANAFHLTRNGYSAKDLSLMPGCPENCNWYVVWTLVFGYFCAEYWWLPYRVGYKTCETSFKYVMLIVDNCRDCFQCEWVFGRWELQSPTDSKGRVCPNCQKRRVCVPIDVHYGLPHSLKVVSKESSQNDSEFSSLSSDQFMHAFSSTGGIAIPGHPLQGAIISPVNYTLPFGITARVGADGRFATPCLPSNTKMVLQMYDPKTGLYDPDIASFTTLPGHPWTMRLNSPIWFLPDTTFHYYPLAIGEAKTDTISAGEVRIEYRLTVNQSDVGKKINIGFHSDEPLTFWLQKPSGEFIVRDSSTTCEFEKGIVLDTAGTYKITITYGVTGGDGLFEVGVSSYPYVPISHLCDGVAGVLSPNLSPYYAVNDVAVPYGDSLVAEPGAQVLVSTNASIADSGYIHLKKLYILSGGNLTHKRGLLTGVRLTVDTLIIETGGKIDVTSKGYRGSQSDGWTSVYGETYPGYTGSYNGAGGSHGGYGAAGYSGDPGDVYDSLADPFALGAGGSGYGKNGGGLIRIEAGHLVLNGSLIADGGSISGYYYGGGAGGTINLRIGEASGTGVVSVNGGAGGTGAGAGGGGGRIAIRWQTGSIDNWTRTAQGGGGYYPGGAGTIYYLGPNDGVDGRLIVDNLGRNGSTTPLPAGGRTQFKSASVLGGAKFTVGALAKQLTVLDSLPVKGSYTQLTLSDSASLTTPKLIGRNNSVMTFGKDLTLSVPQMWVDSSATLITETNLSFADATDFKLTNGSMLDNRKTVTFTIPRFEGDNVVSGTFKNWGILNVTSDSIVVNTGVTLEESGLLSADDSLGRMRILGTLTHGKRQDALSYDTYADTGLVFKVGELVIETGGKIDVTSKGYRGTNRDGWTGTRSETYPGYLGATGSGNPGGSHGGYGGIPSGDAGDVYDSLGDPFTLGAGGGGGIGMNGGGLIRIEAEYLVLNGSLIADGGNQTGGYSGGGAGGTINLRIGDASGTGTMRVNGGKGGTVSGGGGGGGRIAIRWQSGSINNWTITTQGGGGSHLGGAGTIYTEQVAMQAQRFGR